MAVVERPIVPSRLYRYRSLTRSPTALEEEIDSIQGKCLYCPDFNLMNDPMEGFFRTSKLLRGKPDYRRIIKQIIDSKSGLGFACFSETYESSLMWSHYAGNYQGICIGYATKDLINGLPETAKLVRLAYVDEPPILYPSHATEAGSAAVRILSQKQSNWSYEREWRVLAHSGPVPYGKEQAIRYLFFGSRIDPNHKKELLSAIRGTGIRAFMMEIDGYVHFWEEVKVPPKPARSKTRKN